MKNIADILKGIGIEIPDDKTTEFNKAFNENYKTINEVNSINTKLSNLQTKYDDDIKARDTSLEELKTQLENAGTDKEQLSELTKKFEQLQTDNQNAKIEYEKTLAKQQKEFLVREKISGLKFSSNSAKKAFTQDVLAQDLSIKDGQLFGFDDFVNNYKQTDADAFVEEEDKKPLPTIVAKTTQVKEPEVQHKEVPKVW